VRHAPDADLDAQAERRSARAKPEEAPPEPAPADTVLRLQRSAGNVATRAAIQRAPLTAAEKAQNLKSSRYAGDPVLEAAYDNSPPLRIGMKGEAIGKVQAGLVDAGYQMPISMATGSPDGIFGKETDATVRQFQADNGLKADGLVGRMTMGRLDELGGGKASGAPEIGRSEDELGQHVAEQMIAVNKGDTYGPNSGVWYDYNYFAAHQADPANYPWNDDWRSGLAPPEYFDRVGWMDWRLKPGKSASAAIKAWLHGLTIAECLTTITAIEIETIRAALGDTEFDKRWGVEGVPMAEAQRLRVKQGFAGTPLEGRMHDVNADDPGTFGHRNVKVGDWVYFYNHPKYLLKHPGGAWQGENAVYTGDDAAGNQLFTGLGASGKTEAAMVAEMVGAYNGARNGYDYVQLLDTYCKDTPEVQNQDQRYKDRDDDYTRGLYEKYKDRIDAKYREDSGEFPDQVDGDMILNDPPYTIGDTTRKGGFQPGSTRIDPSKL
jgi:peptidoglycan hydrolase-like protein with peptidoglycan-binding domain